MSTSTFDNSNHVDMPDDHIVSFDTPKLVRQIPIDYWVKAKNMYVDTPIIVKQYHSWLFTLEKLGTSFHCITRKDGVIVDSFILNVLNVYN